MCLFTVSLIFTPDPNFFLWYLSWSEITREEKVTSRCIFIGILPVLAQKGKKKKLQFKIQKSNLLFFKSIIDSLKK